jgi:putative heme-binding domain-containing protein
MRLIACLLLTASVAVAQDLVAKTDALSPADELKKFKLPEGFTAQLVASEPDIQKPMQLAFDAKGRMWVTTSYHYPWAAEAGKGSDKLFVLSDFDANGKAKKVQVFDDKLNIPIGVLPLPDCKSVIVSECGKILKLTDTDGDMKADQREVLFEGFGFKDTHGMTNSFTLLPDGWVYACHGFANDSKVKGKDGHEVVMNSGHTFRFKPDGSRIEIFTRGQVNPFGIAVDPWLNLYTADCHSKPVTQLVRGAYYDSFGKPHDGLGYAPHVYQHLHNSTGLCGVVYYAADHFPKEWNGVLFLGNVVTSRINVDRVEWKGSTPVGKELADFLVSDDPWFRPVDIKLGPDGALYVSDFYNKIIGHYEVDLKHPGRDKDRGRVWRIVYTGKKSEPAVSTAGSPRKDWTKAKDDELMDDFGHANTTVRLTAANEAKTRGEKFQPTLTGLTPARSQQGGMFFLVRGINTPSNDAARKEMFDMVKTAVVSGPSTPLVFRALTSKPEWDDGDRKLALDCFAQFDTPLMRRVLIDGMTAHPHADFIDPLLAFAKSIPADDTHMKHAAKVALRNCLEASAATPFKVTIAKEAKPAEYRPLIESLLGCTDQTVVVNLVELLKARMVPEELAFEAGRRIGRYGNPLVWQDVPESAMHIDDASVRTLLRAVAGTFRGVQEGGYKAGENSRRAESYGHLLNFGTQRARFALLQSEPLARIALEVYREARSTVPAEQAPGVVSNLLEELSTGRRTSEHTATVAEVVMLYGPKSGRQSVQKLVTDAPPGSPVVSRLIGLLLANSPTTGDCGLAVGAMKTAPYTQAVLYATGLAGDKFGADLLLASIGKGEAPARLLQEKAVVDRLKATGVKDLDAKLKELTKAIPPAEKRVEDMLKARTAGFPKAKTDVAKGKAIFTKQCAICHTLNNEGAKVGPQLDGIGIRGAARLMEDTLDPNRNVDHTFRATKLDLKDGQSLTGLVREDGAVHVLVDSAGKEHRIPTADVDKKTTSNLSAMPANLDTVMTEEEYYHLLTFLLEQKAK